MTGVRTRLVAAGAVLMSALAIALEASTFDVAFPTDPLGPKAFPLLSAALLGLGGGALFREARREGDGPETPAKEALEVRDDRVPLAAGHAIVVTAASFVAYAFLLAPLGFVPATTLEFTVLALLFGGRLWYGMAVGLVFALVLYALFVYGLGLPLPLGVFEA